MCLQGYDPPNGANVVLPLYLLLTRDHQVSGVTWRPGRGNHGHPAPASAAAGDVHTMEAERRIHGWKS